MRHVPICGYNYDPPAPEPKDEFVIGERYAPVNRPEARPQVRKIFKFPAMCPSPARQKKEGTCRLC